MHAIIDKVTEDICRRSQVSRAAYLARIDDGGDQGPNRQHLPCGNLAHGMAACSSADKAELTGDRAANIAIVSAYNDMLSAHQPFEHTPRQIKAAVAKAGAVAQFAGGVPAMCDGITQGEAGMELSLFSRDIIAMATAIALSHNMFDGALCLGVCDKIVPGLLIGALSFGHLPFIFVPGGPMTSGLPNPEKSRIRQLYAEGKVGREELLTAESASYHSPGTCTFYGTANSNQMLMEIMGLHLPGASFVNPYTPLRDALTEAAAMQVVKLTRLGNDYRPLGHLIDEKAIVNGVVGLLATGGSTNHTMHLVAIARAAGILLTWDDFAGLSAVVPSLTRIYPNGSADVNHFQAAGGMSFLIRTLLEAELLHEDLITVNTQPGLAGYTREPVQKEGVLVWQEGPLASLDDSVLRKASRPFHADGGLKVLDGNLGRGVIKVSAVADEFQTIKAPAIVFDSQQEFLQAYQNQQLQRDFVAVIRFQGPRANGMPELHKLSPALGSLQDQGFHVALVTDGRMSGASGKVAAAIHITPEAAIGGPLSKVKSGDIIHLNAQTGKLKVCVDQADWNTRIATAPDLQNNDWGMGRELFSVFRQHADSPELGAGCFPGTISS